MEVLPIQILSHHYMLLSHFPKLISSVQVEYKMKTDISEVISDT